MKVRLTIKDLLILLDVILFAHVQFHKDEFSALLGTSDESRTELREKIVEAIIDGLSDKSEKEINLTDTDILNLLGYMNNFPVYKDYEKQNRFKGMDIEKIKHKLEQLENNIKK